MVKYIIILSFGLILVSCNSSNDISTVYAFPNSQFESENNEQQTDPFQTGNSLDFDSLIKEVEIQNKPLLLYFTGYQCVNCHKFDNFILSDKEIKSILITKFIAISLYVDDKTVLEENNWVKLENGKILKTVGVINYNFQQTQLKTSIQPHFVIYNSDKVILATANYNQFDIKLFKTFLELGLSKF